MNIENKAYYERFLESIDNKSSSNVAKSIIPKYIAWLEIKGYILPEVTQEIVEEYLSKPEVKTHIYIINRFYKWLEAKFPGSIHIRIKYTHKTIHFQSRYRNIPCRNEVILLENVAKMVRIRKARIAVLLWTSLMINEGLTPPEIANLNIGDYNQSTYVLTVTKTNGKQRMIPVCSRTGSRFLRYLKTVPDRPIGTPMFTRMFYKSLNRLGGQAIYNKTLGKFNKLIGEENSFCVRNIKQSVALEMHNNGKTTSEVALYTGIARESLQTLFNHAQVRKDRSNEMLQALMKHAFKIVIREGEEPLILWRKARYSKRHLARLKKKKLETYHLGGENGLSYTISM